MTFTLLKIGTRLNDKQVAVYAKRIVDLGAADALRWAIQTWGPVKERNIRTRAAHDAAAMKGTP